MSNRKNAGTPGQPENKDLNAANAAGGVDQGTDSGSNETTGHAAPETTTPAAEKKAPASTAKPATKSSVGFQGRVKKEVEGNPIVKLEIDGEIRTFEIRVPRFRAPGYPERTAIEAAANLKLCRDLVEMGSSVLKEIF